MTTLSPLAPPRMTIADFLAFYEARPDGERWELIDGDALMMTPPSHAHQIVTSNIERALWAAVERQRRPFLVLREGGLAVLGREDYRPEPEITLVDADIDLDGQHASRFHMVVEVLSPSDERVLAKKMAYFRSHEPCRCILLVKPREVWVQLHRRQQDRWLVDTFHSMDERIETDLLGTIATVGDFYAHTNLDPDPMRRPRRAQTS